MKRPRLPSVRPTTRRERIAMDRELQRRLAEPPAQQESGKISKIQRTSKSGSGKESKGSDELTEIWGEDLCE